MFIKKLSGAFFLFTVKIDAGGNGTAAEHRQNGDASARKGGGKIGKLFRENEVVGTGFILRFYDELGFFRVEMAFLVFDGAEIDPMAVFIHLKKDRGSARKRSHRR